MLNARPVSDIQEQVLSHNGLLTDLRRFVATRNPEKEPSECSRMTGVLIFDKLTTSEFSGLWSEHIKAAILQVSGNHDGSPATRPSYQVHINLETKSQSFPISISSKRVFVTDRSTSYLDF
jgi:hypothetical protein